MHACCRPSSLTSEHRRPPTTPVSQGCPPPPGYRHVSSRTTKYESRSLSFSIAAVEHASTFAVDCRIVLSIWARHSAMPGLGVAIRFLQRTRKGKQHLHGDHEQRIHSGIYTTTTSRRSLIVQSVCAPLVSKGSARLDRTFCAIRAAGVVFCTVAIAKSPPQWGSRDLQSWTTG